MTLLLLLACTGTPVETDDTQDTVPPDTDDSAVPISYVDSPAEAIDLDPADDIVHFELTAARMTHTIGDYVIDGYAYNGQTPGPTLRAKIGDRVIVDFSNELDAVSTIHWHGLTVPYEMDGVLWSQGGVDPGTSFRYEFTLTQAGSFWYHPHVDTAHQVDHGLYGVLIVEDPADPTPDRELVLVFDDWNDPEDEEPDEHDHGRDEGLWTVNGMPDPAVQLTGGQRVRARLFNTSNHGYLDLGGSQLRWIAGDQGLLPSAQSPQTIRLGPGDRADVEWLPGDAGWDVLDHSYSNAGPGFGEPEVRLRVDIAEPTTAGTALDWPFLSGAITPDSPPTLTYVFTGEAGDWFINGERFPNVTVESLPIQQDSVIEVRNLSGSEHPFHLHGMHFEVLSINGTPPPFRTIEDTWNLAVYDRIRVSVRPQNPGFWMAHCHILGHAEEGMMTVIEVQPAR